MGVPELRELMAFQSGTERDGESAFLPIDLCNYIALIDWTGRIARADKKGLIPKEVPSALSDLNLNQAQWCTLALEIQKESITMFSGLDKLAARERSRTKKPRSPGRPHFRARTGSMTVNSGHPCREVMGVPCVHPCREVMGVPCVRVKSKIHIAGGSDQYRSD